MGGMPGALGARSSAVPRALDDGPPRVHVNTCRTAYLRTGYPQGTMQPLTETRPGEPAQLDPAEGPQARVIGGALWGERGARSRDQGPEGVHALGAFVLPSVHVDRCGVRPQTGIARTRKLCLPTGGAEADNTDRSPQALVASSRKGTCPTHGSGKALRASSFPAVPGLAG